MKAISYKHHYARTLDGHRPRSRLVEADGGEGGALLRAAAGHQLGEGLQAVQTADNVYSAYSVYGAYIVYVHVIVRACRMEGVVLCVYNV